MSHLVILTFVSFLFLLVGFFSLWVVFLLLCMPDNFNWMSDIVSFNFLNTACFAFLYIFLSFFLQCNWVTWKQFYSFKPCFFRQDQSSLYWGSFFSPLLKQSIFLTYIYLSAPHVLRGFSTLELFLALCKLWGLFLLCFPNDSFLGLWRSFASQTLVTILSEAFYL